MRDNFWLANRLFYVWKTYFPDIIDGNELKVKFGRPSKTRLGSIALRRKGQEKKRLLKHRANFLKPEEAISIITINGHLANEDVPEKMIDAIIAHEFCHFVHGFNSLRTKLYRLPHSGGVIDHELKKRGLEETLRFQKAWIKQNWKNIIKTK
ncbi:MAG: hypothetical protein UX62_C0023G0002 [Microgenomates group bacterium GW2011_GWA2_46_7]|nr:MAG: hypothetical protein UX62_C0023G0002 [Microgenomates group bacterium GW2011_GWA2_46_7]